MSNELTLITGNAIGSLLSTPLVGLSTAMNQYINSNKININFTNYSNSALFYMRYIPAAIISASALSFYVSSPILQSVGMDKKISDSVALGSIGPILSIAYKNYRHNLGYMIYTRNMSQLLMYGQMMSKRPYSTIISLCSEIFTYIILKMRF